MVASGERLVSSCKFKQTCINLRGYSLLVDFYLLPLEWYDVILGTQWLSTQWPIQWDFLKLLIKFELGEKPIALHSLKNSEDWIINYQDLQWATQKIGHFFQLLAITVAHSSQPSILPQEKKLLQQYAEVLMKPKELPPNHSCDHKIPTQSGLNPISVKPYRYPYFQKVEIERLIYEMLAIGIIHHNNNIYFSPVI